MHLKRPNIPAERHRGPRKLPVQAASPMGAGQEFARRLLFQSMTLQQQRELEQAQDLAAMGPERGSELSLPPSPDETGAKDLRRGGADAAA